MNYAKLSIILSVIYILLVTFWIFLDGNFSGLKVLSVYSFITSLFFGWWLGDKSILKNGGEDLKKFKKNHILLIVYFIFIFPMALGLNQKIAIFFYNFKKEDSTLKEAKVVILGSNSKGLNRFSGSSLHTVMSLQDNPNYKFPIVCNLLIRDKCQYEIMYNRKFNIKYWVGVSYPFKNYYIIYEIKSNDFYRGGDFHIELYKKNKIYLIFYLIFVVFSSCLIMYFIPTFNLKYSQFLRRS